MKGSEAWGRGAFSTGDGAGVGHGLAAARTAPSPAGRPLPAAVSRWPGLGGDGGGGRGRLRRLRAGLPLTSSTWKRGAGVDASSRQRDLRGKLRRLSGDSALSLFPALAAPSWVLLTRVPAAVGTRGAA